MEIDSLYSVNAAVMLSSAVNTSTLPSSVQRSDQQSQSDNAPVRLNLSPAAQSILSSPSDVNGYLPVNEAKEQESNPSQDENQQSRNDQEAMNRGQQ